MACVYFRGQGEEGGDQGEGGGRRDVDNTGNFLARVPCLCYGHLVPGREGLDDVVRSQGEKRGAKLSQFGPDPEVEHLLSFFINQE